MPRAKHPVVHFVPRYAITQSSEAMCGRMLLKAEAEYGTRDTDKVTCKNCQNRIYTASGAKVRL